MNAVSRTLVYALVAAASVGVAAGVNYWTQPSRNEYREEASGLLFPKGDDETESSLSDPAAARGLRLSVFDDEAGDHETFAVEKQGDVWRLTDFHGYPADAGAQLAKTLASVAYLEKSGFKTRRKSEHAELGVLDPDDRETWVERGHGDRIVVKGEGNTDLVDLIVGKRVEGAADENLHYVRKPGEDEVYIAAVDLDVSTKFSDWINDDLLALDPSRDAGDLLDEDAEPDPNETPAERAERERRAEERRARMKRAEIVSLRSSPSPLASGPVVLDPVELKRGTTNADWELTDLDPATESLRSGSISSVTSTLERLKILGVRPKPDAIGADLKLSDKLVAQLTQLPPQLRQQALQTIQQDVLRDLDSKGFTILLGADDKPFFASSRGQLDAAANNGVVYHLYFGDEFEGTDRQLQFDAAATNDDTSDDDTTKGRYLVVSVSFDEQYVAGRPTAPTPPEKPQPADVNPADPQPADAKPADAKPADAKPADVKPSDGKPAEAKEDDGAESEASSDPKGVDDNSDATSPDDRSDEPADGSEASRADEEVASDEADAPQADAPPKADDASKADDAPQEVTPKADETTKPEPADEPTEPSPTPEELQKQYEADLALYERRRETYERQLADWQKTVEIGRTRAARLNKRFGEWYYVIGDGDFEDLVLDRTELVEKKESAPAEKEPGDAPPTTDPFDLNDLGKPEPNETDPANEPGTTDPASPATKPEPKPETEPAIPPSTDPAPSTREPDPAEKSPDTPPKEDAADPE